MTRSFALLTLTAALLCSGCPGRIADPDAFSDPNRAFSCASVETVFDDIVRPRCATGGCHDRNAQSAGLDVETDGLFDRMLGAPSTLCDGELLLDPEIPFAGYFFDKITSDSPRCGVRMPLRATPLTDAEVQCLHLWLETVSAPPAAPTASTGAR